MSQTKKNEKENFEMEIYVDSLLARSSSHFFGVLFSCCCVTL